MILFFIISSCLFISLSLEGFPGSFPSSPSPSQYYGNGMGMNGGMGNTNPTMNSGHFGFDNGQQSQYMNASPPSNYYPQQNNASLNSPYNPSMPPQYGSSPNAPNITPSNYYPQTYPNSSNLPQSSSMPPPMQYGPQIQNLPFTGASNMSPSPSYPSNFGGSINGQFPSSFPSPSSPQMPNFPSNSFQGGMMSPPPSSPYHVFSPPTQGSYGMKPLGTQLGYPNLPIPSSTFPFTNSPQSSPFGGMTGGMGALTGGNWQRIMLDRLNEVRRANNINVPLCLSNRLNALAQKQAEILKNASSTQTIPNPHFFPPGTTPKQRYLDGVPGVTFVAENVAMTTYNDSLRANKYLEEEDINPPSQRYHFINMIKPNTTAVGLGLATGPMKDRNTGILSTVPYYFWVQIFTDERC